MWMRKIALCVAAMSLSAAAFAAPPNDVAVDQLMLEGGVREQQSALMQELEKEFSTHIALPDADLKKLPPAARQQIQTMQRQMVQILREEMAWEKVQPIYRQIYKETFTQEEIDGMLAFYRSPAGQALLKKTPQATKRAKQIAHNRLLPRITQRMADLATEMRQNMPAGKK